MSTPPPGPADDHALAAYDFPLPSEQIAQAPAPEREGSRLLALDRTTGDLEEHAFSAVSELLRGDEILVVNDTRVVPARLLTQKETGGRVELLLLPKSSEDSDQSAQCMARSRKPLVPGMTLFITRDRAPLVVQEVLGGGRVRIDFSALGSVSEVLGTHGSVPLPPYIQRPDGPTSNDVARYQTIFARNRGAVAAPTAGLHFTAKLVHRIEGRGIPVVPVTLHVGPGTFAPIRGGDLHEHRVEPEWVRIGPTSAAALNKARAEGRRILAVGTTVARTLESQVLDDGTFADGESWASLTIRPGHRFRAVDALLTNFHLPCSSLLVLVAAFAGRERVLSAYERAVASGYRFFSYGDAMLIH